MTQLCRRVKALSTPVMPIPFPSMGVEREKQDTFAPEFEPCTSAACVHVEREKKGEVRRRGGGDEGGILGDEEGTLQRHNVGMVE